jgi:hypothetical protein
VSVQSNYVIEHVFLSSTSQWEVESKDMEGELDLLFAVEKEKEKRKKEKEAASVLR